MKTFLLLMLAALLVGCETPRTMKPVGSGGPDTFEATNIYPWTMERRLDPRSVVIQRPSKSLLTTAAATKAGQDFALPAPPIEYPPGSVVMHITTTNLPIYGKRILVWAEHPLEERWKIQMATTLGPPADWFTPPGYVDENGRVYATFPPNTKRMFIRAQRVR